VICSFARRYNVAGQRNRDIFAFFRRGAPGFVLAAVADAVIHLAAEEPMKLSTLFFPPPFEARHSKRTFVSSPDDQASRPTREVVEFALDAARSALDASVDEVVRRAGPGDWSPDTWPGEHYRLLAGIAAMLRPRTVIEVGTFTGLSALSLLEGLPEESRLITFDLIPWNDIPGTALREEDFMDGRLRQEIADLADPEAFRRHEELLSRADLLFVDGPKDRIFEPAFARRLDALDFDNPPWVLFDDILDRNMLRFWRELNKPKVDLTSFGHWTGTGLVRWTRAA
jgi:predicted O-methyltransferase YrrM